MGKKLNPQQIEAKHVASKKEPQCPAAAITAKLATLVEVAEFVAGFARYLDWLGPAEKHAEGSKEQELARIRDKADMMLSRCVGELISLRLARAEHTRSDDLLVDVISQLIGDGPEALRRLDLYMLERNETDENSDGGFSDHFAWDTYLRVSALSELAKRFPEDIRTAASQMQGWPAIVSHQSR